MPYRRRIIDDACGELLPRLAAIALEGAEAVGKTATAAQRPRTVMDLSDLAMRQIIQANPDHITHGPPPVLINEWYLGPPSASTPSSARGAEVVWFSANLSRLGWPKGPGPPLRRGYPPPHFISGGLMRELSIFVDESGDFGPPQDHSPFSVLSLVFHDQTDDITSAIPDEGEGPPSVRGFGLVGQREQPDRGGSAPAALGQTHH